MNEDLLKIRHSASHILATAVLRLFPDAKLDIGPATETGFYYDFDLNHKFTAEDLAKIEAEMKKIVSENQKFERIELDRATAEKAIRDSGQAEFKLGRLADIPEGEKITMYRNGEFCDLCAGPHVDFTKRVKAFKLLSVAGAYHRGDENNKQLQRIYGTAFASKEELESYLKQMEEAKLRDHRKLGKELGLFTISDRVGQGLILWKPKGAVLRQSLQDFILELLRKCGYQQVFTPHIGKLGLFRTSGHFPYYKDSQFVPIVEREDLAKMSEEHLDVAQFEKKIESGEAEGFLLKPMNCPFHIEIFKSDPHSYRDLPVRLAEFGSVYRWEQSGELNGLTRVRGFTQDDAHIFCTPEQLDAEIQGCLDLVKAVFKTIGMNEYRVRISLRDPASDKYVGDESNWEKSEAAIRKAARGLGVPFTEEIGEAAFAANFARNLRERSSDETGSPPLERARENFGRYGIDRKPLRTSLSSFSGTPRPPHFRRTRRPKIFREKTRSLSRSNGRFRPTSPSAKGRKRARAWTGFPRWNPSAGARPCGSSR